MARYVLLIALLVAAGGRAENGDGTWNQFRGPGGSGVLRAARPPVKIEAACLAWKTPIPPGHSSPVLAGKLVVLTGVENGQLVTLAFDAASGKEAWRQEAPRVPLEKVHPTSSPAAPTPYADDERVYVYFGSFGLLCYDHAGREQWRVPIPPPQSTYGTAASPISHGENLILVLDNDANLAGSKMSQSRILAVKKATGERAWETPRPLMRSGWSTPAIWTYDGGQDLVVLGSTRVYGYDPQNGAEKWFATGFSKETIAVPVGGNGRVYVAAAMLGGVSDTRPDLEPFWKAMLHFDANGDGKIARGEITEHFTFPLRPELPVEHPGFGIPIPTDPAKRKERQNGIFDSSDKNKDGFWTKEEFLAGLSFNRGKPMLMAVRPGGKGDITATHVGWQVNQGIPEIPSPLFYKDCVYMVRNGGVLTAVDAAQGKVVYSERLGRGGQYGASPVAANGHLYLISNKGAVSVVKVGDAFQLAHQYDLEEAAFVTPALDANTIYIRAEKNLYAFRARD